MPFDLLIGAAAEIITPEVGCEMAGFDARKGRARGIHDDLHARALVLDDGRTRIALVSVELLGLDRLFATRVRAEIERRTGIPAGNIVIAATHTHCGPVTFNHFYNQGQPLDEAYLTRLASAIVASAERAVASARPRKLRSGFVRAEGIAVNRRTANGLPVDPDAGVLLMEELDGTPVALAINFACHTTVLGPNTLDISGDFPFYTIRRLQRQLGAGTQVLFFNGAEGDISMGHKSDLSAVGVIAPFRTFEKAEELGFRLAEAIGGSLASLEYEDPFLEAGHRTLHLPLKRYAPFSTMVERRERDLATVRELAAQTDTGREGAAEELLKARQQSLFSRIEEYYALLYEQTSGPDPKTLAAELTALRIGNTALLSFPGEVFVDIALDIRRRSMFKRTMFLGLANDYVGYLPTAEADAAAGYEVVAARVTPAAAAILTEGATNLLDALAG
ncbi:MAG TPA: neutral/alkaline non-lysosomal ceramidase N-terminal domain-containing protein [Bryobacteraceae bacterium]